MVPTPLDRVNDRSLLARIVSWYVVGTIGTMTLLLAVLSLQDGRYVLPVAVGLLVLVMVAQTVLHVRNSTN